MNLSTVVIDGVIKLAMKLTYKNRGEKKQENVLRIYDHKSPVPERVLFESRLVPGVYYDEVNGHLYTECEGRLEMKF